MNPIDQLARECGATPYVNRHAPGETAIAFGPQAWAKFCEQVDALAELEKQEPGMVWRETERGADYIKFEGVFTEQPAAPVAQQPQAEAVLRDVTDNWQQYAKGGETAQQCIERHRGEHDSLLTLLSASRAELGRAYRCIQAMHNALTAMQADIPGNGYHSPTIAAAKRFVWEGAIDGTDYFVGKPVAVLHAALALPKTLDAALAAAPKGQP